MSHEQNVTAILSGTVVSGSGKASETGYPTVNIAYREKDGLPPPGVYAGKLISRGAEYAGAICFGPAANAKKNAPLKLEIYCFDRVPCNIGDEVQCSFIKKISVFTRAPEEEMRRKIAVDVAVAREFFASNK